MSNATDKSDPAWVEMLRKVAAAYFYVCCGFLIGFYYVLSIAPVPAASDAVVPEDFFYPPFVAAFSGMLLLTLAEAIDRFLRGRQRIRELRAQTLQETGLDG